MIPKNAAEIERIESARTFDDVAKAGFFQSATLASAAAWSPDPKNPLYIALPWRNGPPDPSIEAKLAANAPLAMIDQYIPRLKALHAIAFDAGDNDTSIAAAIKILDQILSSYGITHTYEPSVPLEEPGALIARILRFFIVNGGRLLLITPRRKPLRENRTPRQSRPKQDSLLPVVSQPPGERRRDPDAQAIEAVEQRAHEPVAGKPAEAHQQIPWSVLRIQKMSNAPDCKDTEREPVKAHRRLIVSAFGTRPAVNPSTTYNPGPSTSTEVRYFQAIPDGTRTALTHLRAPEGAVTR
jgi:hypothetical protein